MTFEEMIQQTNPCKGDYIAAKRCFELVEEKNCVVTKSIGNAGRYLHLVYIDYCRAMLSDVPWSDDLAVNGFPTDRKKWL